MDQAPSSQTPITSKTWPVVMIGAGPAALSAAIYTTREDIDTLLLEKGVIGGLAAITDKVDNYPGFPQGVEGVVLAESLQKQAERFGARIEFGEVSSLQSTNDGVSLQTTEGHILARSVLVATGTEWKKVGVPGEAEFYGKGVHYCATCDGAFYRDKKLVVVGGGNSAAQESLFLTRFASSIDVLIRGDKWKASDILIHEIENNPKIKVHFQTTTDEIVGENGKVVRVVGTDKTTGQKVNFDCDGVFVFVGLVPNTQFLANSGVELDERGFIKTNQNLATSLKGVFAAGDVRSGATMQIASAAGEGATAALMIREYLEGHR